MLYLFMQNAVHIHLFIPKIGFSLFSFDLVLFYSSIWLCLVLGFLNAGFILGLDMYLVLCFSILLILLYCQWLCCKY